MLQALLRVKLFASTHAPAGAARKDGSAFNVRRTGSYPYRQFERLSLAASFFASILRKCEQLPAGLSVYWFVFNANKDTFTISAIIAALGHRTTLHWYRPRALPGRGKRYGFVTLGNQTGLSGYNKGVFAHF
ncbi:hypothetical protein [Arthrobacter glacialis]|uniref:hypothetical protein n=1 Tax=Arthrobacter glacialis TaxID=1664 RepID=UPI0010573D15|nr:hypothetical protein [Arthrobacter glacialis]